jgi:uncharacterized protein YkwD
MGQMRTCLKTGIALPLLLLATVVAGASPASAATVCASADAIQAPPATLAGAALCLVNQERAANGLPPLKLNRRLAKAATGHSADMAQKDYFSHDSEDGSNFVDRIQRAGYIAPHVFPSLGENLAWGSGDLGSPQATVDDWMGSTGHRRNILNPHFRQAGIGVAFGDAGTGMPGVLYTLDFGSNGRS